MKIQISLRSGIGFMLYLLGGAFCQTGGSSRIYYRNIAPLVREKRHKNITCLTCSPEDAQKTGQERLIKVPMTIAD